MADWEFLNKHRVREPNVRVPERYCSTDEDGFNGMFRFTIDGHLVRCITSDGSGAPDEDQWKWQHVSVSLEYEQKPPPWAIMCKIKELFWEDEDWVLQFHPAKSEYVNFHPYCLHLWRYIGKEFRQPYPLSIMVGPGKQERS